MAFIWISDHWQRYDADIVNGAADIGDIDALTGAGLIIIPKLILTQMMTTTGSDNVMLITILTKIIRVNDTDKNNDNDNDI